MGKPGFQSLSCGGSGIEARPRPIRLCSPPSWFHVVLGATSNRLRGHHDHGAIGNYIMFRSSERSPRAMQQRQIKATRSSLKWAFFRPSKCRRSPRLVALVHRRLFPKNSPEMGEEERNAS
jgi:hypothetical protein